MKFNKNILVIAIASAMPWASLHAQTNAELLKQIETLKTQLEALTAKVDAVTQQPGVVDPKEFNRLVQKMDLAEETSIASGFKGLKFKGVLEAAYIYDARLQSQGFVTGNGVSLDPSLPSLGMLEIGKEGDESVNWMLRLTPGSGGASMIHEASVSVPVGDTGTRLNAGLMPDYQGYEYSFSHQNPLVTHNLLWAYAGPTAYEGVGMSYTLGKWTAKWMFGNIDGQRSGKSPGFAYRGDYTVSEYTSVGFAGAHARTTRSYDLVEVDAGYARGDWIANGQINFGKERSTAANGGDAQWWGVSALAGYKVTPRLQALARFDYINNRKNGGGIYVEGVGFTGNTTSGFGPELDNTGTAIDPDRGANRYALSAGFNYNLAANTNWKTEVRFDRSSGYNFVDTKTGSFRKGNVLLGTSIVVSF